MSYAPYRKSPVAGLKSWLPPVVISGLFWWFSSNPISSREAVLATLLLVIPWYAYSRWQRAGESRVPFFALLALANWAAFAMPLFFAFQARNPSNGDLFPETTIFHVLLMAAIGVCAMGAGMKIPFRPLDPAAIADVSESPGAWTYLFCLMGLGTALSINEDWAYLLGSGGRQIILAFSTLMPIAVCAMLATKRSRGLATHRERVVLGAFLVIRTLIGISSGWLGSVTAIAVVLALIYISEHRRLPMRTILLIVPVVLFLQVGKGEFRELYWTGGKSGSVVEKAEFWLEKSFHAWDASLRGKDPRASRELAAQTIDRVALLPQAANVLEKTPAVVHFQEGKTYSYLLATLIPRFIWPDKPSVNEANRFYQVAYGLTSPENLDAVSISVGYLTEAFMNFGWWGIAPVMFAIGIVLGLFERTLLTSDSGLLFWGLGLALSMHLLTIEAQAAQYLGGMLQEIGAVFVMVLPVIRRRKSRYTQTLPLPEAV